MIKGNTNRFIPFSVDIWAVGWILAELMGDKPIFKGWNDIEQIVMIIKTIGSPDDTTWPEFKDLPDYPKLIFPKSEGIQMSEMFSDFPKKTTDFLQKLLVS